MAKTPAPTTYTHSLEIYVPTQCRCGKPLPEHARTEILDEIKITMAGWFGGNSAKKVDPRVERIEGSWVLGDGALAKEPVDVVQSFTDEDTLIDQREEFTAYVAQLANRLTQEQMLCRIDGKSILYPSAADPKPHRCAGGVTSAAMPKPREAGEMERMLSLQASLQRLGSTNDVRDLFCNILHYDYENGIVPTTAWPDAVKQCLAPGVAPQIVADQNGFKVIYLQLATDSLRKSSERQLVQRLIKDNPGMRGLVVVSDIDQKHWNLVNVKFDRDGKNRDKILLRRMRVGPGQPVRTAVERLSQVDVELLGEDASAADLQDKHDKAFDVEAVTKQFFNDVANWYFWALKNAEFPKDAPKEDDGHDHVSLIRLITRLIFCWFLREKGLLPDTLFDRRQLNDILTGFAPDKVRNKDSVFYRAILQNLFFATLSTETDKRKWATDEQNFMAHSLYRFKECFQKPATALNLFKSIPFLNGGLFECLDRDLGEGKKPRYIRIDGFSRRPDSQPVVPDFLFFGPEREIDLSKEYDDKRFKKVKVRGLIDTLRHYNFTIEENTPIEEEVALDPELCGKVFENLLAAYNPETGTTARKQSGSFYTPREIVNYMVDESLIASLATKLEEEIPTAKEIEPRLRHLFAYNDEPQQFDKKEIKALIAAIDTLKTLDPAVGSGAFPMGLLHKLVFILGKLDPGNEQWKERQIARVREAIAVAEKIEDDTVRTRTVEDLEQQIVNVNESFDRNELDYGRKLYLIENCIYGVDIQPIAVQIAKMRFFISLIVDQKIDDGLPNRGVRPLPNLETKFVSANTLIGIERPEQQMLRNCDIDVKEAELRQVRERFFLARTPKQKSKYRDEDTRLRSEIAALLKGDGWDSTVARKLAAWDPYNQNASAGFFDAEWMYGIIDGFDVVIGNPPWGAELSKEMKALLKECYPEVDSSTPNSFAYFVGAALKLANSQVAYVLPDAILVKDYSKTRRLIRDVVSRVDWYLNTGIPEEFRPFVYVEHDVCVLILDKCRASESCLITKHVYDANQGITHEERRMRKDMFILTQHDYCFNLLITSKTHQIMTRLEQGAPLGDFMQSHEGIHTGNCRDVLFHNKKINQYCKPLFYGGRAGDSIANYSSSTSGWHVDYRDTVIDKQKGYYASLRDERIFKLPKIYVTRTGNPIKAFFDVDTYASNNFFSLQFKDYNKNTEDNLKAVLPLILSSVANYYIRTFAAPRIGNTYIETKIIHLDRIPVPDVLFHNSDLFAKLTSLMIACIRFGDVTCVKFLNELIDACVMECYFAEYMAERRLVFLEKVAPVVASFDAGASQAKQREFIARLHATLNVPSHPIRKQLLRLPTDSPDLLAVIKQEGKV
jgi:adenine-specific DNA-methyltransferase